MTHSNSLKGRLAVLVVAVAAVGAVAAFAAATALADGRTIDGSFCIDATHSFCMQASFDGQTVQGYCAGTVSACTPDANTGGVLTLRPGTYWLAVNDDNTRHDFSLRSCPGADPTSVCDEMSGGPEQEITTDAGTGSVTIPIHLDHGTYRLFCGNDGPPNHEEKGMFVDIVVGGVGQVGAG